MLNVEAQVDQLFNDALDASDTVRRNPVTGGTWLNGDDPIEPQREAAHRAFLEVEWFAHNAPPDVQPLPLTQDDRDDLKRGDRGLLFYIVALCRTSLDSPDFDLEEHPPFSDYVSGVLWEAERVDSDIGGLPNYPDELPELKKRFPPRPLKGLGPGFCWEPPYLHALTMASYRRSLAKWRPVVAQIAQKSGSRTNATANVIQFPPAPKEFSEKAEIQSRGENIEWGDKPLITGLVDAFKNAKAALLEPRQVANPNLKQMNEDYSAGSVGGKFRVLRWMPDARFPFQRTCEFQTKNDFCNSTVNPKIEVQKFDKRGNQVETEPIGRGGWWLAQDHRSEFDGIDFRPGAPAIIERPTHDGRTLKIVNMFSGFSCSPSDAGESGCGLFLAHVFDNICNGDKNLFAYVTEWMASGVQHPEEPGRSALSLRGDPGCGKGVFALGYGHLFGRHFLHATQREHVTGKFNSHQAESCLIFVDEALYSQIKGDAQILKTLTTETAKMLERKGIDAVQVNNFARLIFATNDDHPIQIEHNDRRYPALYVRNQWAGMSDLEAAPLRREYFRPILDQMNNGGREALLGVLLKRDISKFNAEAIPATEEREHQKLLSAPPGDKIVIGFAEDGRLPCSYERPDAARPYADHNRREGLYPAMKQSSGKALQYESDQDLAGILTAWGFKRERDRDGTRWIAPPLAQLRSDIGKKYPAIKWEDTITEWGQETALLPSEKGSSEVTQ